MRELTTKEAAERLNISMRQVQTLIQQSRLPAEKRGRDWFIKESDLALVRERPKTGRPPKAKPAQSNANSEKYGTLETQTRTTRKLNKAIKQSADEEMSSRKKGGKK